MPTYLLTWNPERYHWEKMQKCIAEIQEKGYSVTQWSCRSKKVCEGDRLFMIRLGRREPRGIVASGYANSNVYEDEHWDKNVINKPTRYIDIRLEVLHNSDYESIFPRSDLDKGILKNMNWSPQPSGVMIPEKVAIELEIKWADFLASKEIYENQPENKFYQYDLSAERQRIEIEGYFNAETLEDARQRVTASIVQRQGQSEFRRELLNIYSGQCLITGCDAEPALEAAHIIPYNGVDTNHPRNGLLLRADLHTLFDLHLLSIQPDTYEVVIAPNLVATCYRELAGKRLILPKHDSVLPDQIALNEHYQLFLQQIQD